MINQYILISSPAITSIHILAMFFLLMSYVTGSEIVTLYFVRIQSSLNPDGN